MKRVSIAPLILVLLFAMQGVLAAQACGDQRCDREFMAECHAGGGIVVNPEDPGCFCDYATPIIIDTGDGIALTSAAEGVMFDLRATGTPQRVSWTQPGSHGGFLFLDRNANGIVDDGKEIFGNLNPQPSSPKPNGFLALAEFDKAENGGNGDVLIDEHDDVFSTLRIWIDANHNGISEESELFPLAAFEITSISLDYRESRRTDQYGNVFRFRAHVTTTDHGSPGPWAYDVFLK